ncbi:MAG: tetratricopeptide repeat protein [Planctomycetes bacterium]|nr:tetratricopeptide repeat protein [Planctomycetota bacterium]
MIIKKFKLIALLFLLLPMFVSCATVSNIGTDNWRDYFKPGCSKEEITRDFNLYRGKWWNHYVRGRWYADGGYYDEAIQDFKKSISLRSKDERSARSYGLHFWEYFAHRELGIVYYNQGKYEEAKKELETSLSTADSARAKFYLNKSNEAILKITKSDQEPPEIKIYSHADGEFVNTPIINLKGVVSDDCCANCNNILIQGKKLFIELAEKNINFSEDVPLQPGENVISLEASDLTGKSTKKNLTVIRDIHPPILYLDDVRIHQKDGKQIASVKGTVVDDYGLKEFYINDTEVRIHSYKEDHFDEDIALTDGNKISFKVIDIAGNETRGMQQVDTKASLWPEGAQNNVKYVFHSTNKPILIAASKFDKSSIKSLLASQDIDVSQSSPQDSPEPDENNGEEEKQEQTLPQSTAKDTVPPTIHTDIKSAVVYDANLFFSGNVHDDNSVAKLFVNQSPLEIRQGKHVFFNHYLTLNEGENTITVKAVDAQGNETQLPPVKITKKTFELLETDARYTVALLPLRIFTEKGVPSETVYSMLLKAFDEEPKRFNFVERDRTKLEEILHEQKISNTELTSPDAAIKIGKIRAAEGMLFGAVEEDAKGINVTLRLVDTETTRVLANADVYDEDKSMKNLEWLMHGLSLKMKRQFPMIEGNVIHVSGNGFHVNTGAKSGVGVGMKLLLFREIREGEFVLKEPLDTVARVVQVQPETAFAKVISSKGAEKVEKKDLVITK